MPPTVYKAPKPPLRIKSTPRFGEVYWCDFSISNVLPEFDAEHPAVIIRSGQRLDRPHLVVPLTSKDHEGDVYAHQLSVNPVPGDQRLSWALCNHIYTVASERLRPVQGLSRYRDPVYPKLNGTDLHEIGVRVRRALHRLMEASLNLPASSD